MNKSEEKLSQVVKPTGFSGRMLARFMAVSHKTITYSKDFMMPRFMVASAVK
jgi:hypothetical protein